jgi:hypothetical protein
MEGVAPAETRKSKLTTKTEPTETFSTLKSIKKGELTEGTQGKRIERSPIAESTKKALTIRCFIEHNPPLNQVYDIHHWIRLSANETMPSNIEKH